MKSTKKFVVPGIVWEELEFGFERDWSPEAFRN
jgi:hypothetical protein